MVRISDQILTLGGDHAARHLNSLPCHVRDARKLRYTAAHSLF
jgi:hypothetical protein